MDNRKTKILLATAFFLAGLLANSQVVPNYSSYNWINGQAFQDTVRFNDTIFTANDGNSTDWNKAAEAIDSNTFGERRDTIRLAGASFYSGGGDDDGAFTGDYSLWIGEQAGFGIQPIGLYPVNTGFGYGALAGSKVSFSTVLGAGSGRDVKDMYAGLYTATPTSAQSSMVAIGSSTFRDVDWINSATAVGDGAGRYFNNVYRSTLIGTKSGSSNAIQNRIAKRAVGVGDFSLFSGSLSNDLVDLIGLGFESGLYSGVERGIFLGTYAGFRNQSDGGLQGYNLIQIGHMLDDDGESPLPWSTNVDSAIAIGNGILPKGERTIALPNWDLYLGNVNKSENWDSAYYVLKTYPISDKNPNSQPVTYQFFERVSSNVNGTGQYTEYYNQLNTAIGRLMNINLSTGRTAYQDATILFYPASADSAVLRCVKPFNGASDFVFSRNSVLDRTDSEGQTVSTPINVPRIDFSSNPTEASLLLSATETMSKTGVANEIGDTAGTVYFEFSVADFSSFHIFSLSDGTSQNRVSIGTNLSGDISALVRVGDVNQCSFTFTASANKKYKVAISYSANNFKFYVNGASIGTDVSGDVFTEGLLTKVSSDRGDASLMFNGSVYGLGVWDYNFSDSELSLLTAQ